MFNSVEATSSSAAASEFKTNWPKVNKYPGKLSVFYGYVYITIEKLNGFEIDFSQKVKN